MYIFYNIITLRTIFVETWQMIIVVYVRTYELKESYIFNPSRWQLTITSDQTVYNNSSVWYHWIETIKK